MLKHAWGWSEGWACGPVWQGKILDMEDFSSRSGGYALDKNECISILGSPSLSSCPFLMFSVLCCCPGACYISFPSTTIRISNKLSCLQHAVCNVSREECGGGNTTWGHKVFVELEFDPKSELPGASSERDWGLYLNTSFSKAFYSRRESIPFILSMHLFYHSIIPGWSLNRSVDWT